MVFRTEIENLNGDMEVLQVVSDPISCTQLPGTPEIAKMSLSTCYASGGEELWMIGKNFLKDCVVVFQESACSRQLPDRYVRYCSTYSIIPLIKYQIYKFQSSISLLILIQSLE